MVKAQRYSENRAKIVRPRLCVSNIAFEPRSPSIQARLNAVAKVRQGGDVITICSCGYCGKMLLSKQDNHYAKAQDPPRPQF